MIEDQTVPGILKKLAGLLGTAVKNRRLEIPSRFGSGYCAGFVFNEYIRMLISDYKLKEDIAIENPDRDASKRMIFFKFQHMFPEADAAPAGAHLPAAPSVLIATSRINTDEVIYVHTNTATINIEVDAGYLNGLLGASDKPPVLQSLLQNTQPFLFEQIVYPSLQKIADEIVSEPRGSAFELFFLRIKAEELICRTLIGLEKRDEEHLYALNPQDIETLYKVRESMLQQLEIPPVIGTLSLSAGMSPTKLKRLFRQVFGNSIFSYYQEFRMKKAALLLKEHQLSVSEVGYELGFSNLSHFSRVFKAHTGMKPKEYAMMHFKK